MRQLGSANSLPFFFPASYDISPYAVARTRTRTSSLKTLLVHTRTTQVSQRVLLHAVTVIFKVNKPLITPIKLPRPSFLSCCDSSFFSFFFLAAYEADDASRHSNNVCISPSRTPSLPPTRTTRSKKEKQKPRQC